MDLEFFKLETSLRDHFSEIMQFASSSIVNTIKLSTRFKPH